MSNTSTKPIIARVLCDNIVTYYNWFRRKPIYLLNCQCYIELNPVLAPMVEEPALYRWSRYRFNALGKANQYVSPHSVYLSLGKDSKSMQAVYRGLFQSELDNDIINDIRQVITENQPLGNSRCLNEDRSYGGAKTRIETKR